MNACTATLPQLSVHAIYVNRPLLSSSTEAAGTPGRTEIWRNASGIDARCDVSEPSMSLGSTGFSPISAVVRRSLYDLAAAVLRKIFPPPAPPHTSASTPGRWHHRWGLFPRTARTCTPSASPDPGMSLASSGVPASSSEPLTHTTALSHSRTLFIAVTTTASDRCR